MNALQEMLAEMIVGLGRGRGRDVHPDDAIVLERIGRRFAGMTLDGCVLLRGMADTSGRPVLRLDGRMETVARVIVAIRDDLVLHETWRWHTRHTCDVPECVRPDHLTHGTVQDNADDKVARGRSTRGERSASAKLTEAQARAILHDTRLHRVIADEFGISRRAVSSIKSGATWAHLHDDDNRGAR